MQALSLSREVYSVGRRPSVRSSICSRSTSILLSSVCSTSRPICANRHFLAGEGFECSPAASSLKLVFISNAGRHGAKGAHSTTRSTKRSRTDLTASRSCLRPARFSFLMRCHDSVRSSTDERRTMTFCKVSELVAQQSRQPDTASRRRIGKPGDNVEKSSRMMSSASLIATRSELMAFTSWREARSWRAKLAASAMI